MASRLPLRIPPLVALLLLALPAVPARAQSGDDVTLDANPQLFTVLCALRGTGLVPSVARSSSQPAAAQVERALAQLDPALWEPLRNFSAEQQRANAPADLNAYVSLALLLTPPPGFELSLPRQQLPPDVVPLENLPPLLRTFYDKAGLAGLWRQVLPEYERALAARQPQVAQLLLETRGYLRLIGEAHPARSYTVYVEWLVPPALTSARNYGQNYFVVIHPQRDGFAQAVRHQYLHFVLDPITAKYAEPLSSWSRLLPQAARAPRLAEAYRQDLHLLVTESLAQAIELRLRNLPPAQASAELDRIEGSGFIFARHFFDALADYEKAEPSIRYYFPDMLRGFDVELELARLARVEFLPVEAPPVPVATAPSRETSATLLSEADSFLRAGNFEAARERFERVLSEFNADDPAALYGLAIVASAAQDREQAKRYFLRVLEHDPEPRLSGWTHVYLGRIYDLEGDRSSALEHYRAALALSSGLEKVEQAARRGLEQPYGGAETPPRRDP